MFQDELTDYQKKVLRTTKIVAGALIAGPAVFAVVAIAITVNKQPGEPIFAYIAVFFTVAILLARSIVPRLIVSTIVRHLLSGKFPIASTAHQGGLMPPADAKPEELLYMVFLLKTIIENALVEGAVCFTLVAYIVTALTWCLAFVGAMIVVLVLSFPTQWKAEQWVENQLQQNSPQS